MMKFSLAAAAAASLVVAQPLEPRASGDLTWYEGGLTACGINLDTKTMDGVAVSFNVFETFPGATPNPNQNPICNSKVRATHTETGVTMEIPVVDKCSACKDGDLDGTEQIFKAFGFDLGRGRVPGLQWEFIGGGGGGDSDPTTQKSDPTTQQTDPTTQQPDPTTQQPEPTTQQPEPTTQEAKPTETTAEENPTLLPVGNVGANPSNTEATTEATPPEAETTETQSEQATETQAEQSTETQVNEPEPTDGSSDCVSAWTSCNERFDGTEEAVKNYKCHTVYVQCVDAQLKATRGTSAKRMHRKRLVGLGHSSF